MELVQEGIHVLAETRVENMWEQKLVFKKL